MCQDTLESVAAPAALVGGDFLEAGDVGLNRPRQRAVSGGADFECAGHVIDAVHDFQLFDVFLFFDFSIFRVFYSCFSIFSVFLDFFRYPVNSKFRNF